jgi:hypothetical protein
MNVITNSAYGRAIWIVAIGCPRRSIARLSMGVCGFVISMVIVTVLWFGVNSMFPFTSTWRWCHV